MAVSYREFAIWILGDLAVRETENDRIAFTGNHVSIQHPFPFQLAEGSDKGFLDRITKFKATLPRHSDLSERLAIAVRALMLDGEKAFAAADLVREILRKAPKEVKAQYEELGIAYAFRSIDTPIGATHRNRRTKRKKVGISPEVRQAESIRSQASRFIKNHKKFDALFALWLGTFRFECCRDADWFASVEPSYVARVVEFEKHGEPFDWYTAMPVAAAAQFYHEQLKFSEALFYYRKAITAAMRAVMPEHHRARVLHWLETQMHLCEVSQQKGCIPPSRESSSAWGNGESSGR
ncbi:MAG: hypothetical protein ABSF12_22670 [Bryobacteraceae bacterium]